MVIKSKPLLNIQNLIQQKNFATFNAKELPSGANKAQHLDDF